MKRFRSLLAGCYVLVMGLMLQSMVKAQDSLSDTVVASSVAMGEPTAQSLQSFRKTLLASAESAVKAKEMSRLDLFRLRIATMNKATLEKMHQACAEQVLSDGQAQSYGAIDWSKLLAAFKEFLPILLELIKLFAYANPSYLQSDSMLCYWPADYFTAA